MYYIPYNIVHFTRWFQTVGSYQHSVVVFPVLLLDIGSYCVIIDLVQF